MSKPCVKCGGTERTKRGDCKACQKKRQAAWYQLNKSKVAQYKDQWCQDHPDRAREFDLGVRVKRYGLSVAEFHALFAQQGGLCSICGQELKRVDIDHDHGTGVVRGLLCHSCNIGLGAFQDDPTLLLKAAEYLQRGKLKRVG